MKVCTLSSWALVVGAAFSLSACGIFSNDSRYEPVDLTEYQATVQPGIAWNTSIGSDSAAGFAPTFVQDSIFAATPDGHVARVNAATGATFWNIDLDQDLVGGVGVGDGIVVVNTREGAIVALDAASGKQRWTSRTSTVASAPALVGNGVVVVRADDFRIQAFSSSDGTLLWSYVRTNPDMSLKTSYRMVFADNQTVLAAVPVGRLVALDIKTGRALWDVLAASLKGPTDLDGVTDVVGQPVVYGNDLCIASYQGNVVCYAATRQGLSLRWGQPFSTAMGIDGTQSAIVGAAIDGTVAAFARQDGHPLWSDQTLKNRGLTNPVVFNNHVVVADYEGYAHFYNFLTGKLEGRISLGSSDPVVSPLIVTPHGIVAQTGDGDLVLFGAK